MEYIESTSSYQYIDTGIYADKNTEVEMVAKTNGSGVNYLFGTESSGDTYLIAQTGIDGTLIFDFRERSPNPDRIKSSVFGYDDFHKIEVKNQSFYVDDVQIGSFASINNFTATRNSYLVGVNGDANYDYGALNVSGSKIKYCKIWQSGTLVRDFIPVKRNSDNVIGMYDTVTNTFFENAGTGTFIAGPTASSNNNCQTINITWGGLSEPDASGMCVYGETFTAPSTAPTAPSGLKFLGWIPR